MKALIMVRTSTEAQSIEDQKRELIEFCKSEGYDNIECVERQGASAAKVDDEYRQMIDEVKEKILHDSDIKCFAVWHLNRLARTEEVWVELKSFFVKHQVQIICKNPYLKLLTPDGKVDPGIELAMGLLAILAKQDQEERKAKFKRAKASMLKKGQYVGGNSKKYGYKVVDKTFVEDENEGKVVRMIYDLYSTGKYSSYTLSDELKERGYHVPAGKVMGILSSVAYIGEEVSETGMHYPQIISKELWEQCREIREGNRIVMKRGEKLVLCAKLVKCPTCGATCTSNSRHLVCSRHAHRGPCSNGFSLRREVVDDLAWRTAYGLHMDYLLNLNETKKEEYRKEKEILDVKIIEAEKKMDELSLKKGRIVDTFLEGLIDRKSRDLRLSKLQDEVHVHLDYLSSLQGKRDAIVRMLEDDKKDTLEAFNIAMEKMDSESMFEIVHKHIEKIVPRPVSFGIRDKRTHRPNGVEIIVSSVYGQEYKYMYVPKFYQGHNLYIWNGKEWIGDQITKVKCLP